MKLHILGVNGPFPESNGATSGYLLEAGESLIQCDLGSGVLARLSGLTAPEFLSALFVSHWHFDHTADLPVLMYRLDAMGFGADGRQLPVYGPVDESSAIRKIIASSACFTLKDIAPGDTVAIGDCTVHVGDARHPVPAIGFRAECGGRIFGYTGDTNTLPSLPSFYQGCHLLLADGLFPESAWAEQKPHLSAALAAAVAREAKVEKLVLTHLNPLFSSDILLREARKNHAQVTLAAQGACMEI